MSHTFNKKEKLCRVKMMDELFSGGNKSYTSYPVRMIIAPVEEESMEVPVSVLISVPKKYKKHAVDRNRIKRQLREAYRMNKQIIWNVLAKTDSSDAMCKGFLLAFIWLSEDHYSSEKIQKKVILLLQRAVENL